MEFSFSKLASKVVWRPEISSRMFRFGVVILSLIVLASQNAPAKAAEADQANWTLSEDSWNYWWSYSGPSYWGLINSQDWSICDKGRRQSPINIETNALVYDPNLTPLRADNDLISGLIYNDGHAIVFNASISLPKAATDSAGMPSDSAKQEQSNGSLLTKRSAANSNSPSSGDSDSSTWFFGAPAELKSAHVLKDLSEAVDMSIRQRIQSELTEGLLSGAGNEIVKTDAEMGEPSADMSFSNQEHNQIDLDGQEGGSSSSDNSHSHVHFTGAGLAYSYKFEALYLRFTLDSSSGSEHQIDAHSYAAELQLLAYNDQLYKSFAEASSKPNGLLGISILVNALHNATAQSQANSNRTIIANEQLDTLVSRFAELRNRGSSKALRGFNLSALLPETSYFVTYEGSLTTPGCHESVTWLLLNKPLYMKQSNLDSLRSISADEPSSVPSGTLIAGNIRPLQPVNTRPIRTNIKPTRRNSQHPETCKRLWTKYEYKQTNS